MNEQKDDPNKARDALLARQQKLEAEIDRVCASFERDTGLHVVKIHHPRDRVYDDKPDVRTPLKNLGTTKVMTMAPRPKAMTV